MKRIIFSLLLIACYAPASIALSCSMGMETAGHMMNHDTTMNQSMEHMNHQSDMMAHHPDESVAPETDSAPAQSTTEQAPIIPESKKQPGNQGDNKTESSSHTHSLP